jgi:hypothetical protein
MCSAKVSRRFPAGRAFLVAVSGSAYRSRRTLRDLSRLTARPSRFISHIKHVMRITGQTGASGQPGRYSSVTGMLIDGKGDIATLELI